MSEMATGRRFNLLRYFVLASLLVLVIMAILSALAFGTLMRRALIHEAEKDAVDLACFMADEFVAELGAIVPADQPIPWTDPMVQEHLAAAFVRSGGALGVIKVKVFDEQGQIIYSTDPDLVGRVDKGNLDFQNARSGQVSSKLMKAEEVADLSGEMFVVDVIETYVPVVEEDGGIRWVFEIYQDASDIQAQVWSAQVQIAVLSSSIMFLLFIVLFLVVRRADQIITQQTDELASAYAALRRSEQIKSDLTHMIVHDMKNPLTSINGYVDILPHAGPLTDIQAQYLQIIRRNSQRLLTMINNMLDISRLEEGKLELQLEAVPVREIVEPVIADLLPLLETGDKTLHLDLPDDLPPLRGDRELLSRVMGNLLTNAEKHTERGGNIWIVARPGEEPATLRVSVRDDGEGIPPEFHKIIFEKFSQASSRRLGRKTDTGLGLAFCQLVAQAHGGTIGVESAVGQGSTFTLTLPAWPQK